MVRVLWGSPSAVGQWCCGSRTCKAHCGSSVRSLRKRSASYCVHSRWTPSQSRSRTPRRGWHCPRPRRPSSGPSLPRMRPGSGGSSDPDWPGSARDSRPFLDRSRARFHWIGIRIRSREERIRGICRMPSLLSMTLVDRKINNWRRRHSSMSPMSLIISMSPMSAMSPTSSTSPTHVTNVTYVTHWNIVIHPCHLCHPCH